MITEQCTPTLIFTIFSLIQIIVDMLSGLYEIALLKFFIMTTICYLLNTFCSLGLSSISWLIIFVPFIFLNIVIIIFIILKLISYLKNFFVYNNSNTYCPTSTNNMPIIEPSNESDNNIEETTNNINTEESTNANTSIDTNSNETTNNVEEYNINDVLDNIVSYYINPYSSVPDYSSDPQFK